MRSLVLALTVLQLQIAKVYPAASIRSTVISWPAKVHITPELPEPEIKCQRPQMIVPSPIIRSQQLKNAEVMLPQNSSTVPHSAILFHAPFGPKIRALNIPLWGVFSLIFVLFLLFLILPFYISWGFSFSSLLVGFIFAVVQLLEANTTTMALLFLGIKNVETALTIPHYQLKGPNSIELSVSS
jgi:hypothetical protein